MCREAPSALPVARCPWLAARGSLLVVRCSCSLLVARVCWSWLAARGWRERVAWGLRGLLVSGRWRDGLRSRLVGCSWTVGDERGSAMVADVFGHDGDGLAR